MTSAEPRLLYNLLVRTLNLLVVFSTIFGATTWAQNPMPESTGFDSNLRSVSVTRTRLRKYVIWVSGSKGVILRSLDEGKSWKQLKVEGGADLDFRDLEAFGANTAYAMSSGDGEKSRIFKTTDGGKSWALQYTDKRPGFFLDSLACPSPTHCFALSDPVEGKFLVLVTHDGQHWKELPRDKMPAALPAEGAFAASGTSIAVCDDNIYFGTGGPDARILHSADSGRSWTATETPLVSGNPSSGIFSVACLGHAVAAVGGDYRNPSSANKTAIYSKDSGATWSLAGQQPAGYRSAVAFLSSKNLFAAGTNGSDVSSDGGAHWKPLDTFNMNAISIRGDRRCAVGPKGTVIRIRERPHEPRTR